MGRKIDFVHAMHNDATALVKAIQRVEALARVFQSEGYQTAGADELVQADLEGNIVTTELDVADVQALMTDMVPTLTTWLDTNGRRAVLDRLVRLEIL